MAEVDGVVSPPSNSTQAPRQTFNNDLSQLADRPSDTNKPGAQLEPPKLSKNQQKKLKRRQEWEEGREARKIRRKEKNKERKARRREEFNTPSKGGQQSAEGPSATTLTNGTPDTSMPVYSNWKEQKKHYRALQLPLAFVFDCDFDDLMTDTERISLASQLTRSYSDNRKARYRAHMLVSSFGGKLKERFEGILGRHHEHWKGVTFTDGDFLQAADIARQTMKAPTQKLGSMKNDDQRLSELKHFFSPNVSGSPTDSLSAAADSTPPAAVSGVGQGEQGEVVYLTSDSPHTLTHLKPFSTYIIGGLVDKNRHKGICYKRACSRGVKTAKLPIGEYMRMSSRQVLATNHVGEIMLKWLECGGDWGRAFDSAIPKRKGGVLKEKDIQSDDTGEGEGANGSQANSEYEDVKDGNDLCSSEVSDESGMDGDGANDSKLKGLTTE